MGQVVLLLWATLTTGLGILVDFLAPDIINFLKVLRRIIDIFVLNQIVLRLSVCLGLTLLNCCAVITSYLLRG